jgi:hypothetical protein
MDVVQLSMGERNRIRLEILRLQQLFDIRQAQQDHLARIIQENKDALSALDTQVATFPTPIAIAVGVAVADQAAEVIANA